ncbi:hypothetical protein GA0070619_1094 [Micromonospora zamorensis]|nr:hypothetical protein GA0070619_1094 [Micromonospora zamorensis]
MRSDWTTLPESVTAGIAERVGGSFDVVCDSRWYFLRHGGAPEIG